MEKILLIDDDEALCYGIQRSLSKDYDVITAHNPRSAYEILNKHKDIVLTFLDIRLGDTSGIHFLERLKKDFPEIPVIMITAFGTSDNVIESIKLGAKDFLTKPVDVEDLVESIEKYKRTFVSKNLNYVTIGDIKKESFIGISREIRDILKIVASVSATKFPVLILGESGTGKELIANLIHKNSGRKGSFVPINCAAIPRQLIESELFGYEEGAFSGATAPKPGKFELAQGGTIFLDEIGEISKGLQSKLLRVLESGEIERLGGTKKVKLDVRVLTATNKKVSQLMDESFFRPDLYFRISGVTIKLPPLRERIEDLEQLATYFISIFSNEYNKKITAISKEALDRLKMYSWPGNVRELKNVMNTAVMLADSFVIEEKHIKLNVEESWDNLSEINGLKGDLKSAVEHLEKDIIAKALKENNYHLSNTADFLGISRVTLNAKMKRYGIHSKEN